MGGLARNRSTSAATTRRCASGTRTASAETRDGSKGRRRNGRKPSTDSGTAAATAAGTAKTLIAPCAIAYTSEPEEFLNPSDTPVLAPLSDDTRPIDTTGGERPKSAGASSFSRMSSKASASPTCENTSESTSFITVAWSAAASPSGSLRSQRAGEDARATVTVYAGAAISISKTFEGSTSTSVVRVSGAAIAAERILSPHSVAERMNMPRRSLNMTPRLLMDDGASPFRRKRTARKAGTDTRRPRHPQTTHMTRAPSRDGAASAMRSPPRRNQRRQARTRH